MILVEFRKPSFKLARKLGIWYLTSSNNLGYEKWIYCANGRKGGVSHYSVPFAVSSFILVLVYKNQIELQEEIMKEREMETTNEVPCSAKCRIIIWLLLSLSMLLTEDCVPSACSCGPVCVKSTTVFAFSRSFVRLVNWGLDLVTASWSRNDNRALNCMSVWAHISCALCLFFCLFISFSSDIVRFW